MIASSIVGVVITAFLLTSVFFVPLCKFLAYRYRILDIPDGVLKRHKQPVAYLGGVAVFFGAFTTLFLWPCQDILKDTYLVIGSLLLLIVGLWDDVAPIKPWQKFLGQFAACALFVYAGFVLQPTSFYEQMPFLLHYPLLTHILAIAASCWWMLTIINAFNLIDIMDGLAAVVAVVGCITFGIIALHQGSLDIVFLLLSIAASLAGFFLYNKPPASMYLGDAGSLWIGGVLSIIPFFLKWGSLETDLLLPFFVLFIPLVEVCCLIVIRLYKNIPVYYGSPDHFICFLKKRGWSIRQILGLSGLVSVGLATCAIFVAFYNIAQTESLLMLSVAVISWVFFLFYI